MATKAGIVARYQGKQRYLSAEIEGSIIRLVLRNYGEVILDELDLKKTGREWVQGQLYAMQIQCDGDDISVTLDGEKMLTGKDHVLCRGGAGFMFENGIIGARDIRCYSL